MDLSTPAIATPTRATTSPNTPTRISVPVVLLEPLPEKNSDSRMIAPNSATEADASTSWPKRELVTFASFRTGKITLTDEAASTIATNSGDETNPPAFRPRPMVIAIANESANPIVVSLRTRPRRRSTSISRPERNSSNASPIRARVETGRSALAHPSPDGPITMPSTSSSTTAGSRNRGKKPSASGASRPIVTTLSRFV